MHNIMGPLENRVNKSHGLFVTGKSLKSGNGNVCCRGGFTTIQH